MNFTFIRLGHKRKSKKGVKVNGIDFHRHSLSDRKAKRDKEKAKDTAFKKVNARIVLAKQTGHYFSGSKAYQAEL